MFPVAGKSAQISVPPLWPILSPTRVHQSDTPHSGMVETTGDNNGSIAYIDNLLLLAHSKEEAHLQARLMLTIFQLGFSINTEKSLLSPCQQIQFLDVIIQSHPPALHLPLHKLQTIKSRASQLLCKNTSKQNITVREMAKFIGTANAAAVAIPPAPLFYKP